MTPIDDTRRPHSGEASAPSDDTATEHVRAIAAQYCDACGAEMRPMGHCKYWCLTCGFLRTCNDVL